MEAEKVRRLKKKLNKKIRKAGMGVWPRSSCLSPSKSPPKPKPDTGCNCRTEIQNKSSWLCHGLLKRHLDGSWITGYIRGFTCSLSEPPSYATEITLSCMVVLYRLGGEVISNGAM